MGSFRKATTTRSALLLVMRSLSLNLTKLAVPVATDVAFLVSEALSKTAGVAANVNRREGSTDSRSKHWRLRGGET